MEPIYKSKTELIKKIKSYFNTQKNWAPRAYRIYLGLSKEMIYKYKKQKPEWYNLIIDGQDKILALLEQKGIYSDKLTKGQTTSIIFILRAYDSIQYIPEIRDRENILEHKETIINLDFKQPKKKGTR